MEQDQRFTLDEVEEIFCGAVGQYFCVRKYSQPQTKLAPVYKVSENDGYPVIITNEEWIPISCLLEFHRYSIT